VTDVPSFTSTSYYLDDSTPTQDQCTGDAAAYGSSGPWINHPLPNTDPRSTPFNSLRLTRTIYYEQPGKANGAARAAQAANQFQLSVSSGP
jgi:hypothetical protein